MSKRVTLERIDKALAKIANIIERSGSEKCWPIFERLEKERLSLFNRTERLQRAKTNQRKASDHTQAQSF